MLVNMFLFLSLGGLVYVIATFSLWLGWWALIVPVALIYVLMLFIQKVRSY